MKLELHHLTPYLPYALKVIIDHGSIIGKIQRTFELDCGHDFHFHLQQGNVKPILRPMSDLTSVTNPCKVFSDIKKKAKEEYKFDQTKWVFLLGDIDFENQNLPYWVVQILVKHHFDVFGLIEKGLAIDINTISKEESQK